MKLNVKLTADELMNVVDAAVSEAMDRGYDGLDVDELTEDMTHIVDAALSAIGIEIEEDEPEDDEEEIESIIYDCDGKRGISAADARLLMQCVAKTMHKQHPILSDEALEVMGMIECLRIAEVYGIEVVDIEGE